MMKKLLNKTGIVMLLISIIVASCKKKEVPVAAPQVYTTGISEVTGTCDTSGGSINS